MRLQKKHKNGCRTRHWEEHRITKQFYKISLEAGNVKTVAKELGRFHKNGEKNLVSQVNMKRMWRNHVLTAYITNHGDFPSYFRKCKVYDVPTNCSLFRDSSSTGINRFLLHYQGLSEERKDKHPRLRTIEDVKKFLAASIYAC